MSNTGNTNTQGNYPKTVSGYGHNRGPSMPFTGSVVNTTSGGRGVQVQVQQTVSSSTQTTTSNPNASKPGSSGYNSGTGKK
ncbi:hypothetical protein SCHPADRAFT_944475 [Schizopora paradoxa]|uniref:Uncharacterized protein n=1 Tax=Schizopora paradoxa TaxID=27342 RepID=A0A0H2R9C9_9AGAM|nr:hypothetical protein SCHPADRAFT_944475 [Schizopora paradoxa]